MSKKNNNENTDFTEIETNTRSITLLKDVDKGISFNESLDIFKDINSTFYNTTQAKWFAKTINGGEEQSFFNRLDVVEITAEEISAKKEEIRNKKKKNKDVSDDEAINTIATQKINKSLREKGSVKERGRGSYGLRRFICRLKSKTNGSVKILFIFPAVIKKETKEENNRVKAFLREYVNSDSENTEYKFYPYFEALDINNKLYYCDNKFSKISMAIMFAYIDIYTSVYTFSNNAFVFGNVENDNIFSYTERNNNDKISLFNCFLSDHNKQLNSHVSNNNFKYMNSHKSFIFSFNVKKLILYIKPESPISFKDIFFFEDDHVSSILTFKKDSVLKANKSEDYNVYKDLDYKKLDARHKKSSSFRGKLFSRSVTGQREFDSDDNITGINNINSELVRTSPKYNFSGCVSSALIKIGQYLDEGPFKETIKGYFSLEDAGDKQFSACKKKKDVSKMSDFSKKEKMTQKVYVLLSSKQIELFAKGENSIDAIRERIENINSHPSVKEFAKEQNIELVFEVCEINDKEGHKVRKKSVKEILEKSHKENAQILFIHLYDKDIIQDKFGDHAIPHMHMDTLKIIERGGEYEGGKIGLSFDQIVALKNIMESQTSFDKETIKIKIEELLSYFDTYTYIKGCNKFNLFNDNEVPTQGIYYDNFKDSKNALDKTMNEVLIKDELICKNNFPFNAKDIKGIKNFKMVDVSPIKINDIYNKIKKIGSESHCNFDFLNLFFDEKTGANHFKARAEERCILVTVQDIEFNVLTDKIEISSKKTISCAIKKGKSSDGNENQKSFQDFSDIMKQVGTRYQKKSLYFIFDINGERISVSEVELGDIALCLTKSKSLFQFLSSINNDFIEHTDKIVELYEDVTGDREEALRNNINGDLYDKLMKAKINENDKENASYSTSIDLQKKEVQGGIPGSFIFTNENMKFYGANLFQVCLGVFKGNKITANRESDLCKLNTFAAIKISDKKTEFIDMPKEIQNFFVGLINDNVILTKRFSIQSLFQKFARLSLGE